MKLDEVKKHLDVADKDQALTADETADLEPAEDAEESMQERVDRVLREKGIDMTSETAQKAEPRSKDEDNVQELMKSEAKMHYDKEDLIQFHELMLSKPLIRACSDLDYDHPTII